MSPTVPISKFVEEEMDEPSLSTVPTAQPTSGPTAAKAIARQEARAQVAAQLGDFSLPPPDQGDLGRVAQEGGSDEAPRAKPYRRAWESTAPYEPDLTEEQQKVARFRAKLVTDPKISGAIVIHGFGGHMGELQLNALVDQLSRSVNLVAAGDMRQCEAILVSEAVALQAIFTNLAQRASLNMGQRLDETERCLRMALKAQNQCRMTIDTLAALKNPRAVVAQQTNIANGPQQVNNGPVIAGDAKGTRPRVNNNEPGQNELIEVRDGERLDTGTTGTASGADQAMAPLGPLNGAEDD